MQKLRLEQVTLVALTSVRMRETIQAMEYSMRRISFGEAILFSDEKPAKLPAGVRFEKVPRIATVDDYSRLLLFELFSYIRTSHVMVIQWDGYVVHPRSWKAEFLQYDYIGALWPSELNFRDEKGRLCRVGNGGASLRSRKLMELPAREKMAWQPGENEDVYLCCKQRCVLEAHGVRFAPPEVACLFSHERVVPENKGISKPFAFHKWDGDNVQYPKFHQGTWVHFKQKTAKALIILGVYEPVHRIFRKLFRQ